MPSIYHLVKHLVEPTKEVCLFEHIILSHHFITNLSLKIPAVTVLEADAALPDIVDAGCSIWRKGSREFSDGEPGDRVH